MNTAENVNVFALPMRIPGPEVVFYRPIRTNSFIVDDGDWDIAPRRWDQLARQLDGSWLYRAVSDPSRLDALPALLPPDLAHKMDRKCDLLAAWEEADVHGDERECERLNALIDAVVTREMTELQAVLSQAFFRWQSSRKRAHGATGDWIDAPIDLSRFAEEYHRGCRPRL